MPIVSAELLRLAKNLSPSKVTGNALREKEMQKKIWAVVIWCLKKLQSQWVLAEQTIIFVLFRVSCVKMTEFPPNLKRKSSLQSMRNERSRIQKEIRRQIRSKRSSWAQSLSPKESLTLTLRKLLLICSKVMPGQDRKAKMPLFLVKKAEQKKVNSIKPSISRS